MATVVASDSLSELRRNVYSNVSQGDHWVLSTNGGYVLVTPGNVASCPAFPSCESQYLWIRTAHLRSIVALVGCGLVDLSLYETQNYHLRRILIVQLSPYNPLRLDRPRPLLRHAPEIASISTTGLQTRPAHLRPGPHLRAMDTKASVANLTLAGPCPRESHLHKHAPLRNLCNIALRCRLRTRQSDLLVPRPPPTEQRLHRTGTCCFRI